MERSRGEAGRRRTGGVIAAGVVALVSLVAWPATGSAQRLAQYDWDFLAFRGFGFDAGYIWPNRVSPTPVYGLRIDLGYLGPGVRVAPTLRYWSSRLKGAELERLADRINRLDPLQGQGVELVAADLGPIDWENVSLGVDGHFVWLAPLGLMPYVGAGAAVHVLNGAGPVVDGTFVEDLLDSVSAGIAFIGGLELDVLDRRLRVYAESSYTLLNNVRYPGLRLGAAYMLRGRGDWLGSRETDRHGPFGARRGPAVRPGGGQ